MAATIREVASKAGVSVATVSRVLNNSGPVKGETRERILEAAHQLRYVPNNAARSLITAKTHTLGVLLPNLSGGFFSEVIRGIEEAATMEGFHVLVSNSHSDRSGVEAAVRTLRGRVDGFIVMSPDVEPGSLQKDIPEALPGVMLNCFIGNGSFDYVNIDNEGGVTAMLHHLREMGHSRIAVITGAENNFDSQQRLITYRRLMESAGLYDPSLELRGDFTERSGHAATKAVLKESQRPTAIFAFNDSMAIGALSALQEAGLGVPDDISVTGFDDVPLSRYLNPPLTTVHVPISELGARSMSCLIDAVRRGKQHTTTKQMLKTTLVIRRSSGSAAFR